MIGTSHRIIEKRSPRMISRQRQHKKKPEQTLVERVRNDKLANSKGSGQSPSPLNSLFFYLWNISTKIAAIKNIGARWVTPAHCQDCRGRNQIFLTENQSKFFIEILYMEHLTQDKPVGWLSVEYHHVSSGLQDAYLQRLLGTPHCSRQATAQTRGSWERQLSIVNKQNSWKFL